MTDAQLYFAVGLPILAVLVSLVVSLVQISGIREDMRGLRGEVRDGLRDMRTDMHVEVSGIREDIKVLTGKVHEMMGHK
jgi:hypothetical protein